MKKQAVMFLALLSQSLGLTYADNLTETRGIGQYPGRPSQFTAPKMVKDQTYRNIALNRMVYTSSSADFNLTGHLVTDGIITSKTPSFLSVKTNEGELSNRDKEKMIDGNTVTSQYLKGEDAFVEFNWEAMKVNLKNLKFTGELAYYKDKASEGYVIRVLGSHNGTKWEVLGEEKGTGLPGEATRQQVSSDPNKFQDVVRLPLRKLNVNIPLKKQGNYEHVRIEMKMKGAAWWRIKLIDNTTSWRPSMHFSSVWKSGLTHKQDAKAQWLYVDLGTEADFDQVNLYWVNKARQGKIQVSNDAKNWSDIATLGQQKQKGLVEKVACKGHGRYVKLQLIEPDASGRFALSEMQVMGKGGLHAEAANTLASKNGKQMFNQWQLRREGSDAWGQHDYTLKGAQGGESFNNIMEMRYGKPQSAEQFTKWAQWLNYDGYRAMYESSQQDRLGLLIWMSHACWPSMVWCTYDYYFEPTAAYFGVKKACEPLHIQYNPVKKVAEVVNFAGGAKDGLVAKAQVFDMYGKLIKEESKEVNVAEDQTLDAVSVSEPDEEVYYIKLTLEQNNQVVSDNFYVMGKEEDNLQALSKLPKADVAVSGKRFVQQGEEWVGEVEIRNTGNVPALLVRLNLKGGDGEQILPVIYSDNYFCLMPNECKTIKVSYRDEDGRNQAPYVEITGFNK